MSVVTDVSAVVDEVHALYSQVLARSPLQFEKLTKPFLIRLGAEMPERVRFFLWRQADRLVAFSLCLVHDGVLHDEYLGLDYRVALDLHLYFVTFRDVLTWAIEQRLREYRSTPLNYDPKLHLGFELVPLDLYAAHPQWWLNVLLHKLLPWFGPIRGERALPEFPNFSELEC
jgi:predicted N-acyltransferase